MSYVLVTGATGFLGAYVVRDLVENGYRVKAMVRKTSPVEVIGSWDCDIVYADLTEPDSLKEAVKGVDAVVHTAYSFAGRSTNDPFLEFKVNEAGSLTLLDQSRKAGVKNFIFTSSSTCLGTAAANWHPVYTPMDENHPCLPVNAYGAHKAAIERWCLAYYHEHNLKTVVLRPRWIYGPYRPGGEGLITLGTPNHRPAGKDLREYIRENKFLSTYYRYTEQALKNETIEVPGGGFHMTHVRDVAKAHRLALEKNLGGEIYNLADDFTSWEDWVKRIIRLTSSSSRPELKTPALAYDFQLDNRKIKEHLGMNFRGKEGWDECVRICLKELSG